MIQPPTNTPNFWANCRSEFSKLTSKDLRYIIGSLFLIIMGSLMVTRTFVPSKNFFIYHSGNSGPAMEGGFCIALGICAIGVTLGYRYSARFRSCIDNPN